MPLGADSLFRLPIVSRLRALSSRCRRHAPSLRRRRCRRHAWLRRLRWRGRRIRTIGADRDRDRNTNRERRDAGSMADGNAGEPDARRHGDSCRAYTGRRSSHANHTADKSNTDRGRAIAGCSHADTSTRCQEPNERHGRSQRNRAVFLVAGEGDGRGRRHGHVGVVGERFPRREGGCTRLFERGPGETGELHADIPERRDVRGVVYDPHGHDAWDGGGGVIDKLP